MTTKVPPKMTSFSYLVAIPIPYLDRHGEQLSESKRTEWIKATHKELFECFGGTLQMLAPGTNVVDGKILYEEGQILIVSLCADKSAYQLKRKRIRDFAVGMGAALDQDSVLVLSFTADAQILEIPRARD